MTNYDKALGEKGNNNLPLQKALKQYLFQNDERVSDGKIQRIAMYVSNQLDAFRNLSDDDILAGSVNWIDLETQQNVALREWRKAISLDGRTYFWNVRTRESRWKDPYA
jgi:hypothetical protein